MSNKPQNNQAATIIATLTELGLGQNEAVLYQILLENPDATIPVLQQKSPFSRTMLYYVIENLERYGLLTTSKNGKKTTYLAEPPAKLQEFMQTQEKELVRQKNLLKDVIGDLEGAYRLAHHKPGVKFFEGKDGVREVTFDSLTATDSIYTFADTEAIERYGKDTNSTYVAERMKRKIPKKLIASDTPFARQHYANLSSTNLLEVRLIPKIKQPFKTGMQIYNNKISYSTLTEESQIGVIIEDKNIAQMHRDLFEYIWNTLPHFSGSTSETARP